MINEFFRQTCKIIENLFSKFGSIDFYKPCLCLYPTILRYLVIIVHVWLLERGIERLRVVWVRLPCLTVAICRLIYTPALLLMWHNPISPATSSVVQSIPAARLYIGLFSALGRNRSSKSGGISSKMKLWEFIDFENE